MTPKEHTILLVSDDAALRAAARHELETSDDRRQVSSVSTVDAARRILRDAAPAVILLTETLETGDLLESHANRLGVDVSSLASYAPVVVIGDAGHQTELSGLVAAGAADYVVRTGECLTIALGLVERRLRQAQNEAQSVPVRRQYPAAPAMAEDLPFPPGRELHGEDFGEVLRHELNNPLTGILGNAELLLSEIRRKSDGRLPQGAPQRLETIAALAVRLRESVRRLSTEWESRQQAAHSS
ncbi:MAG TPA: histidine kinase dimerization/phospho-acceptor domain-containing protein [Candidatus Acidoferrum sp.]